MKALKDKRVLIVSSEVVPYMPQSEKAVNSFQSSKKINDNGGLTRIFMPKYGLINERRHQLHEVIRLSGMNLVINDLYMPLIIKVASIPKERMQVYFIDNEDYFKKKELFYDKKKKLYKDNDLRMIFFVKGVIETVKKLNWSPDIIYLHGVFTSLFPLYLKELYFDDPMFLNTKIISSIYKKSFSGKLSQTMSKKVQFDEIDKGLDKLSSPTYDALIELMIDFSDGIVLSSEEIDKSTEKIIKSSSKPVLSYKNSLNDKLFMEFFAKHLN